METENTGIETTENETINTASENDASVGSPEVEEDIQDSDENDGVEATAEGDAPAMEADGADMTPEEHASSTEAETVAEPAVEKPKKMGKLTEAAWAAFSAGLLANAKALGLESLEQKGFIKFINSVTGHKLYVAKQGREVTRVDTTLPLLNMEFNGAYELDKPNGRIQCHVTADEDTVLAALTVLSTLSDKLPPPKRAPKAAPAEATPVTADAKA